MAKRIVRQRTQLPNCYYEGYLEKRSFKDKTSRKLWTCLCGDTLFFFNNNKDNDYVEKMGISTFISITDDYSCDRNLGAARFTLQLKNQEIKLTAPSLEAREFWKGFIYSVVKLSLPSCLNLLPGQIHMLKAAIDQERERIQTLSHSAPDTNLYVKPIADMPECYHQVSRTEAQLMLERNPEKGNMLLRPGRNGNSFAVTTRQDHNGSVFRHYRVASNSEGGFSIDVDDPVSCSNLHQVIDYLVEKTEGILLPFVMEATYEDNINYIKPNEENGEMSILRASPTNAAPSPPHIPPKPVVLVPFPKGAESETEELLYLNDQRCEDKTKGKRPPTQFQMQMNALPPSYLLNDDYINITSGAETQCKTTKLPLMPPPRVRSSSSSTNTVDGRQRGHTLPVVSSDPLADELKQKLQMRRNLLRSTTVED